MNKETSLASQLRKLKVPQTNVFNETRLKISFLYDPKDAFTIDTDSHFGIAVNSFHSICQIDPSLEEFENDFFNLASKEFDRGMINSKEAHVLNQRIRQFLFRVITPYFLLSHTHKLLEWLIFKYLIHDYNTDHLILSVLPYHETKLFARVIQCCSIIRQPTNQWHWLLEIQNQGVSLSKLKFLRHCSSQLFIIRTLIDEIISMVKENYNIPILISFVTSTLINLVERDQNSNLITIIIYYITKGFKSSNLSFIISSYIVFAHLSTKITFKESKLAKLFNKMSKYYLRSPLHPLLETDFYLSLAVIYKYQKINFMTDVTLSAFEIDEVINLHKDIFFNNLISSLLCKLINTCSNEEHYLNALKILNSIEVTKSLIKSLLITVSEMSINSDNIKPKLREIIATLERRYPLQFDSAIQEVNSIDFHDLLASSMYAKFDDSNENIWTALIHSNSKIRLLASIHIQKNVKQILNIENQEFQKMISLSLTSTWNESHPSVLIEILECQQLFFKFVSKEDLFEYGKHLLPKCSDSILKCSKSKDSESSKNWLTVQEKCLNLIRDLDLTDEQFLVFYGNSFLALDDADFEVIKILFQSCPSSQQIHFKLKQSIENKIIKSINEKNSGSIVDLISSKIALYITEHSNLILLNTLSQSGIENFRKNILCLCILYHLLPTLENEQFHFAANKMVDIFSSLVKVSKLSSHTVSAITSLKNLIISTHSKLIKSSLNVGLVNFFLGFLINLIRIEKSDDIWFWHRLENSNHFFISLFNFLCEQASILPHYFGAVLETLLNSFLKEISSKCPTFISSHWGLNYNPNIQFQTLSIGLNFISNYSPTDIDLILLFIALRSKSFNVREIATQLVQRLADKNGDNFFIKLSNQSEFLKNDENQICLLLAEHSSKQSSKTTDFKDWFKLIIDCLSSDNIPINVQINLFGLLSEHDLNNSFDLLLPVFQKLLHSDNLDYETCSLLGLKMIKALSSRSYFKSNDPLWMTFMSAMNNIHFRPIMLRHFTSQQVQEFSSNSMIIVCFLLDLLIETNDKTILKKIKKFLGDGSLVANIINSLTMTHITENGLNTRKRRKALNRIEFSIESPSWKKAIIVLDLVLTRESFSKSNELVLTLFDLLKESFILEEKSALEYFRYLLLSNIDLCSNQEDFNFQDFDIQFIFEALRLSRQRETQRAALVIINKVSSHFKDEVLQNIMTIFSYIGDNMIKCDDQYTHKILDDTMDVIIKNMAESEYTNQSKIIEIFIDAIDDIPAHRRLYLFHKLTSLLGEEESLWYISLKLCENGIYNSKDEKHRLELTRALICNFKCSTQLFTLKRLIDCIDTIYQKGSVNGRYNEIVFKEKDKSIILSLITQVIQLVVSSDEFVTSIAQNKWSDLKNIFKDFLESLLLLIAKISKKDLKKHSFFSMGLAFNDLFKILEKINHLLPFNELSSVLHMLLKSKSCDIRRKALDLLNSRLASDPSVKNKISFLRSFIKPLQSIIEEIKENDAENIVITCQTAQISIKLIAKLLKNDKKSVGLFIKVLNSIIFIINEKEEINVNFLASSLLCSTALTISLQQNSLTFIPSLVSIILKTLQNKCDIVVLSSVTALSKLIHYFHKFLSPYLTEILIKLCLIDSQSIDSTLKNKVNDAANSIANLVQFRILISSFEKTYDQLLTQNEKSLQFLFQVIHQSLLNLSQVVLENYLTDLQKFIIKVLDYRSTKGWIKEYDFDNAFEDKCIEAIITFVPKLSEASFRSFFYKVYDWSILSKDKNTHLRLITFYRLTNSLADTLKSLFCAFAAPYIINNCLQQLELFNIFQDEDEKNNKLIQFDEKVAHLIIVNILATLGKCFLYDINSSFSNKERVTKLISPIVDQINNDFGSTEEYNERIEKGVISCTQNLAKAVSDHHLIKDLNYKILLKTRDNSLKIRYQALRVLHHLILSITEEYLPLLPEAVPFLAELHEDDSEELQKLLLNVFNDIERIFGEPIASYF